MTKRKKFPIGTQDFETLKKNSEFYLDKTPQLHSLLKYGGRYNFLSRPRRFGKSLMLSVLKNLFLGKKELFEGLYISNHFEFKKFPVLYLSFAGVSAAKNLEEYIKNKGRVHINDQIIKIRDFKYFDIEEILEETSQKAGQPIVVLIDEYDKPILVHLKNIQKAEAVRDFFQGFYASVKDSDQYIKFFLMTGLTKLMKMSIFSELNHLKDISFIEKHTDLIGYTQNEVENNFKEEISVIAKKQNKDIQQILQQMKNEYNGFNFGGEKLYNPWDINNFIENKEFGYYWSDTGIPSAIRNYMKSNAANIQKIIDKERTNSLSVNEMKLRVQDLHKLQAEVLFFNAGYLTIRNKDEMNHYYLKFPNKEAEQVMLEYFLDLSLGENYDLDAWKEISHKITSAIFDRDQETIQTGVTELIYQNCAHLPYDWHNKNPEDWLKSMVGVAIRMNNIHYIGENQNIIGRTDLHIPKDDTVYVLEFKVDGSTDEAIAQIEENYESSYRQAFSQIIKIGVNWMRKDKAVEVLLK